MNNTVTIIIITRNNLECISQVTSDIYHRTTHPYNLIIVDNDSSETEVINYLSKVGERNDTRVLRLSENLFYFPAINEALKQINRENRYTLILNDDVVIESELWIQHLIDVLESDDRIAYVGDFMKFPFCPPLGGWIDGWCMFFRTAAIEKIGLFDDQYIWWYGPAEYAVRTLKFGYRIKDIKRPGDYHNRIRGIITHLGGRTFNKVKNDSSLPLDAMFCPDFRFEDLLLRYGFYWYYLIARFQRTAYTTLKVLKSRLCLPVIRRATSFSVGDKVFEVLRRIRNG
jgi:glycosyltransferase involved in cell wall biosynthesis